MAASHTRTAPRRPSTPSPSRQRRIRGEGSIYELAGGGWRGAAIVVDPITGRRVRRYLSGPTADAVRVKLTKLQGDADRGVTLAGPRLTVGTYLARWIASIGGTVRPSTVRGYESHVRTIWTPLIGSIPLAKLSPADVERAMGALTTRGLSPLTVRGARATLRRALSRAVRDGLIQRNVASLAAAPRVPGWEIEYLPIPAIKAMIAATAADEYGPAWAVAVTSGVRLGELCGLQWPDVDLKAGALTVRRALARDGANGWALAEPKTTRSRRTIPLAAAARVALGDQQRRQDAARAALGRAWQDRTGAIFTDRAGRPVTPTILSRAWHETADRLALGVPFRALRHSAATAWLTAGVPLLVVSQTLGHTSIGITAQHYSAVAPELRSQTASAMDRALGGEL